MSDNRFKSFVTRNKVTVLIASLITLLIILGILFFILFSSVKNKINSENANLISTIAEPTTTITPTSIPTYSDPYEEYYNSDFNLSIKMPSGFKDESYDTTIDCYSAHSAVVNPICKGDTFSEKVRTIFLEFGKDEEAGSFNIQVMHGSVGGTECQSNESTKYQEFTIFSKVYKLMLCVDNTTNAVRSEQTTNINIGNGSKYLLVRMRFTLNKYQNINIINKIFESIENKIVTDVDLNRIITTPISEYKSGDVGYNFYNNNLYIRINDNIYKGFANGISEDKLSNIPSNITWNKLDELPTNIRSENPLYGVTTYFDYQNKKAVISIMYELNTNNTTLSKTYLISDKIKDISKIVLDDFEQSNSIESTNNDYNYLQFHTISCTGCEGGEENIILLNLETGRKTILNETSYFKWLDNGNYEYKDFVPNCTTETKGKCPTVDPSKLPLKTGTI